MRVGTRGFQEGEVDPEPTRLNSRGEWGSFDCGRRELNGALSVVMRGHGRSVGPLWHHDQEHKNWWEPFHLRRFW